MRRLIALFVAVVTAVGFAACRNEGTQSTPSPQGGGGPKPPLQEEPPIKVRNGSIEVRTPDGTKWEVENDAGAEQWTQDKEHGAGTGPELHLRVEYGDGTPTCTGDGKIIEIVRDGRVVATFKRTGKKIKLGPKNTFAHGADPNIVIDTTSGQITRVVARDNPNQVNKECEKVLSVDDLICIASVPVGGTVCQ